MCPFLTKGAKRMPLRFGEHTPRQVLAPPSQTALFLSLYKQEDGPTKPWFYLEAVNTGLIVNTGLTLLSFGAKSAK